MFEYTPIGWVSLLDCILVLALIARSVWRKSIVQENPDRSAGLANILDPPKNHDQKDPEVWSTVLVIVCLIGLLSLPPELMLRHWIKFWLSFEWLKDFDAMNRIALGIGCLLGAVSYLALHLAAVIQTGMRFLLTCLRFIRTESLPSTHLHPTRRLS